jgi:hypothetical protein
MREIKTYLWSIPSPSMKALSVLAAVAVSLSLPCFARDAQPKTDASAQAAQALISRVLPGHADQFVCEIIPQDNAKDVFEIEASHRKIVLRGNNGVSIAMALSTYLRDYAKANYDCLAAGPLKVNRALPLPTEKIRRPQRRHSADLPHSTRVSASLDRGTRLRVRRPGFWQRIRHTPCAAEKAAHGACRIH